MKVTVSRERDGERDYGLLSLTCGGDLCQIRMGRIIGEVT